MESFENLSKLSRFEIQSYFKSNSFTKFELQTYLKISDGSRMSLSSLIYMACKMTLLRNGK